MKKIFTSVLILISVFSFSQIPNFQWVNGFSFGTFDVKSIQTDATGNLYLTGYFIGNVNFDPVAGPFFMLPAGGGTNSDTYVVKLDPSGNFVWATQLDHGDIEGPRSISLDASGNIYITGVGAYAPLLFNQIFISKISNSGIVLWDYVIGGPTYYLNSQGYSIKADNSGNVYTTGYFTDTLDFDPGPGTFTMGPGGIFVSKLTSAGNFVWAKQFGAGVGRAIDVDNLGDVYCSGDFFGSGDFDPGPSVLTFSSKGYNDIFVTKLNSSGNFVWAKQIGDTSYDGLAKMTVDNSNNVYLTGSFYNTLDFDPGPSIYTLTATGIGIYVCKLDVSGNFVWAKQTPGPGGVSLAVDAVDNLYLTGSFKATGDFDPGPATFTMTSFGNYDMYYSKLDPSGNFLWSFQLGDVGNDISGDIAIDGTGAIYSVGSTTTATDFDPGPSTYTFTPPNVYFQLKLSQGPTAINESGVVNEISIFPNPTSGQINLRFDRLKEKAEIKIYNSLGQIILQKNISSTDKISLSISDQSAGIYFVEVNADGERYRAKVVKE